MIERLPFAGRQSSRLFQTAAEMLSFAIATGEMASSVSDANGQITVCLSRLSHQRATRFAPIAPIAAKPAMAIEYHVATNSGESSEHCAA